MWYKPSFQQFLRLWLLVMTVTNVAVSRRSRQRQPYNCLKNFKAKNITSTSVKLRWDFDCDEEKVLYKITYKHLAWLACGDEIDKRDAKPGPVI